MEAREPGVVVHQSRTFPLKLNSTAGSDDFQLRRNAPKLLIKETIDQMKNASRLLLCLIFMLSGLPSIAQTQESDVLNRDSDERVNSLEERQQTVAILLTAAETALNNGDA